MCCHVSIISCCSQMIYISVMCMWLCEAQAIDNVDSQFITFLHQRFLLGRCNQWQTMPAKPAAIFSMRKAVMTAVQLVSDQCCVMSEPVACNCTDSTVHVHNVYIIMLKSCRMPHLNSILTLANAYDCRLEMALRHIFGFSDCRVCRSACE